MALGTPYTVVSDSAVVSSGNTRQATISANVAIGDTIVVFPFNNISVNAASVTDSAGHTYTQQVVQGTGNGLRVTCWTTRATAAMTSGSDWIKVTWSSTIGSTCQVGMHARACSGVATGAYVDSAGTTGTSLTGSTTPAAVSGTTARAQTSEWLLSCAQAANSSTGFGAWSGGFTQQSLQHQSGQPYVAVADQVTAATTAINGTVVETVSAAWQICQIALKADLGGATVVPLFGMDNQTALSTWNDMEAKLGTAAIKVWRGYNGPGLPASYPGHDAPVPPGVTQRIVSFKPTLPLSGADQTTLATLCSQMTAGDWLTLWHEGEASGYTPAVIKAAHSAAYTILHANAPAGCKYGQILMAYTAYSGSAHFPLGQWVATQTGGANLDFYGLDIYPTTPGDASFSFVADRMLNAIKGVISNPPISIIETNFTTDDVSGITWNQAQDLWFTQAWAWAKANSCVDFLPYFFNAHNVPWPPGQATINVLKAIVAESYSTVAVTTVSLPDAEVGQAYSQTLTVSGGTAPYTWALATGSAALPDGLAISSGGVISGTPTGSGTFSFTVQVTDTNGNTAQAILSIRVADALTIITSTLPGGQVGSSYAAQLATSGGTGPLAWSLSSGTLPTGLSLNTSTGAITGVPSGAGTSPFTVQVNDAYTSTTKALAITITAVALAISTGSLPVGTVQSAYTATLAATAGTPPYTWTVTGGALPPGLSLSSGGVLSGTPTQAGSYQVTITVTDNVAATASATFTIVISESLESLVISGHIELLQGGVLSTIPECIAANGQAASFVLQPGYDLSAPQNVAASTAAVYLDGERPVGRRASNRTIALPIKITAPDRATLAAAREILLEAIDHDWWELTWSRPGGPPMVFDCFRADPTIMQYALEVEQQLISQLVISFQALPYGRSDTPVVADFPVPLVGSTAPPPPVVIDPYSTVTGTNWSQSLIGPGPNSAFWRTGTNGVGAPASYTRSGIGPFNLVGQQAITVWVGLGSSKFFAFSGLKQKMLAKFTITLTDGTKSVSAHLTRRVKMSGNSFNPVWQKVRIPIPQNSLLNYAAVTGYTFSITTRSKGDCPYTDVYLDTLSAVPYATAGAIAPTGGIVYDLAGTVGSARSLASLQLQQPAGTVATVEKRFSTPGAQQWLAPNDVAVTAAETYGPGGRGGVPVGGGPVAAGAGGAGGYMGEAKKVTPGSVYQVFVPDGGNSGSGTAGSATFTADDGTVTAAGGTNVGNSATGGAGGAGGALRAQATGQESNFDGGIGNWTGTGNGTPTPDAVVFDTGSGSLKLTSIASGDMSAGSSSAASFATLMHPCSPLLPVTVNGRVRAAVSARQASVGAEFFDSAGNNLGQQYGADTTESVGSFVTVTQAVLTPPLGAIWYREKARIKATGGASEVHNFDNITSTSGATFTGGTGGNGAGGPNGGGGGGAAARGGNGLNGAAGNGTGNGGAAGPGDTVAGSGGAGCKGPFTAARPGAQAGGGGGGGVQNTAGGVGGKGGKSEVVLTYQTRASFKTLVVHRPKPDAPDTLVPFVQLGSTDTPDGTSEYAVDTLVPGSNARFDSTYTVVLVNSGWHNPTAARDLTVRVRQYEQLGGTLYTKAVTRLSVVPSNLASPLVVLGEVTLPDHGMAADNTDAIFAITVTSTDLNDRFQDCLFLDVAGSTVMVESPTAYVSFWIDEPPIGREVGNVLASNSDRGSAVSVLAWATVSGPPMYVDPIASCQALLLYAAEGPPSAQLTYFSRWMLDRVT